MNYYKLIGYTIRFIKICSIKWPKIKYSSDFRETFYLLLFS